MIQNSLPPQIAKVLLDSKPTPERHPDRFSVIGELFGLSPAPAECCKMLEIGCGSGSHLLALAHSLPKSSFVGIDFDLGAIEAGRTAAAEMNLENIVLAAGDFTQPLPELESEFDYLLCHGVFSWVTPDVQTEILVLCSRCLAPQGIASISYNVLPGWSTRSALRDSLKFFDNIGLEPPERVARVRSLLASFRARLEEDVTPYGVQLKDEIDNCTLQSDHFIFRELLAEVNQPIYFADFMNRARCFDLQYLGDARPSRIRHQRLSTESLPDFALADCGPAEAAVRREQCYDFLVPTPFRLTLLCRAGLDLQNSIDPQSLLRYQAASALVPLDAGDNPNSSAVMQFCDPREYTLEVSDPLIKAALLHLHSLWPRSVAVPALFDVAKLRLSKSTLRQLNEGKLREQFLETLLEYYQLNQLELYRQPPQFTCQIAERPRAHPLARIQAALGGWTINYRHEYLWLDPFEQQLLPLLDGSRTVPEVLRVLSELLAQSEFGVREAGQAVTSADRIQELLEEKLTDSLKKLADCAFLTANDLSSAGA